MRVTSSRDGVGGEMTDEFRTRKRDKALIIGAGVVAYLAFTLPTFISMSAWGYWWGWLVTLPVSGIAGLGAGQIMLAAKLFVRRRWENRREIPVPINVRLEDEDGTKITLELRHLGVSPDDGTAAWGADITEDQFIAFQCNRLFLGADDIPMGCTIALRSPVGMIMATPRVSPF